MTYMYLHKYTCTCGATMKLSERLQEKCSLSHLQYQALTGKPYANPLSPLTLLLTCSVKLQESPQLCGPLHIQWWNIHA